MRNSLYSLTNIHRRVEDAIRREASSDRPSPWRLLRLKTLRLMIKHRLSTRALRVKAA